MTGTRSRQAGSWSSGAGSRRRRGRAGRGSPRASVESGSAVVVGAMPGPSSTAVPASLSGRRLPDRRGLLVGQRRVRAAARDGLRVDPRARARVEAREDPAVAVRVEQGEREALVPAGLLERVVADEADPLEALALGRLEDRGPGRDVVELACRPRRPSRDGRRAPPRGFGPRSRGSARPAGPRAAIDRRASQTTATASDDDGDGQERDDDAEVLVDERVEVDRVGPPGVAGV